MEGKEGGDGSGFIHFGLKVREGGERVSGMAGGAPGWSGLWSNPLKVQISDTPKLLPFDLRSR